MAPYPSRDDRPSRSPDPRPIVPDPTGVSDARSAPSPMASSSVGEGPASTSSTGAGRRRAPRRRARPRPRASAWAGRRSRGGSAAGRRRRRDGPPRPRPVRRADGDGLRPGRLAGDVVAVAEGSGAARATAGRARRPRLRGDRGGGGRARLGDRCARLVLVDGGSDVVERDRRVDVDEFLRGLDEPPEVMRSMAAYLPTGGLGPGDLGRRPGAGGAGGGRRDAGRPRRPATRPHALEACVRTMFAYRPARPSLAAPVAALVALGRATTGPARGLRRCAAARASRSAGRSASSTSRRPATTCCATGRTRSRPRSSALAPAWRLTGRPEDRAMRVVYSPAHLAHDTSTETVLGVPDPGQRGRRAGRADPRDARGRRRLRRSRAPTEHGTEPILAVHDPGLVRVPRGGVGRTARAQAIATAVPRRRHVPDASGCSRA